MLTEEQKYNLIIGRLHSAPGSIEVILRHVGRDLSISGTLDSIRRVDTVPGEAMEIECSIIIPKEGKPPNG